MLKKWLLSGALVLVLILLGLAAPWWWPRLLDLAGTQSSRIQGLASLVQMMLWIVATIVAVIRFGLRPGARKPDPPARPDPPPSIEHLEVRVEAPEAADFLRRLGLGAPPPDLEEAARVYLQYLVDRYQFLELQGMGVSDRVALKLPLLEMYVPLKARLHTPEGETWARQLRVAGRLPAAEEGADMGERLSAPVPVLDLLQKHGGLVLLGDPGAGKTTFLKVLALALASGQGETLRLGGRLPILLPLAAYANALADRDVSLDDFIARYYEDERKIQVPLAALLARALQEGSALLLLDGLDEVRDAGRRHLVVDRVRDFYSRHRKAGKGGNRFVLTSRIVGYREVRLAAEGLVEATLVDFDDEEIEAFLGQWTAALEKAVGGETEVARAKAEQEREELLAAVRTNPGVRSLAANPLLLTILALMKRGGIALPNRRVELYKNYVETLLKHWNLARSLAGRSGREVDLVETMKILEPLALWMHEVSPGVGLVKEGDLRRKLESLCAGRGNADPARAAESFLKDVRDHSSLLLSRGEHHYGFIHLTFQEYLAAVALARKAREGSAALVAALAPHVGEAPWHEVVLLAIGHLAIVDQWEQAASEVVEGLLKESPGPPGEAAVWMGEAVADAGPGAVTAACRQKVVAALLDTLRAAGRVEPARRAAAGKALAAVGDPRREVMTVDALELRTVPAGPFRMGSEKDDPEGFSFERPAHDCDLPYEYRIGRYPVTVAQFREYVEATGELPRAPDSLRPPGNQPVARVSWFEALAFCRWLERRWRQEGRLPEGWSVSLPSEAEWEKAARGTDKRRYPWDNDFDPERANTSEAKVQEVSSVGCFPGGTSPSGCEEMSGNVFEWTRSLWGKDLGNPSFRYPYVREDGREDLKAPSRVLRVLRSGSFFNDPRVARCASRYGLVPGPRLGDVGFRVVVLPFSSGL
ncbi:MAG TPA: SUMF1/EgtB/PvdO family nonheme iron enzyme [Thermoanaerobaculia bacterium]|nr:SUMF1/EgtB/PvdO family nonheme iron enzyme [Thermoanaerobaculia bacterium]